VEVTHSKIFTSLQVLFHHPNSLTNMSFIYNEPILQSYSSPTVFGSTCLFQMKNDKSFGITLISLLICHFYTMTLYYRPTTMPHRVCSTCVSFQKSHKSFAITLISLLLCHSYTMTLYYRPTAMPHRVRCTCVSFQKSHKSFAITLIPSLI
jgi:hypothetical protein